MRITLPAALVAAVLCMPALMAQQPAPRPMPVSQKPAMPAASYVSSVRPYYDMVKGWITKSAALMPDNGFAFAPATAPASDGKSIRGFGQVIGHIADANHIFCSTAMGSAMAVPLGSLEKTKTTKADLQAALADSFALCDKAWATTTDANALTPVTYPAGVTLPATTRLGALAMQNSHLGEHYGNLVTYLRAKGLVPPSSSGGQ